MTPHIFMTDTETSLKSFDHHSRKHAGYFDVYEKHFRSLRDRELNILEIGIQYGGSVEMWRDYFPRSRITGIDIDPLCKIHSGKRISIKIGDQADPVFLSQFADYDIIIDDGGHTMNQQQTSFECLFPLLNPGGIYVIEDLHTSYWPEFLDKTPTTMEYLASLTHTLNSAASKSGRAEGRPAIEGKGISEMHFYPSMCFIYKQVPENDFGREKYQVGNARFKIHQLVQRIQRKIFGM